jgi:hypothetical protein
VQSDGVPDRPKPSNLTGHFVGHVLFGAVGFVALAIPAVLFSIAAHYLATLPVSTLIINVLIGAHYVLFAIDIAYFGTYIIISVYGAAKELIRYAKSL